MGSYTNGIYVPVRSEVGWDDEVNDDLIQLAAVHVNVKAAPFGAAGDGITDDSAAIQAAIDTQAPVVYFPGGTYRIGTALRGHAGQHYRGTGAADGYLSGNTASVLKCSGANHTIFDINAAQLDRCTFEDLTFKSQASRTDTAFKGGTTGGIVSSTFWRCAFLDMNYDFDLGTGSQYLIVWHWYTKTNGPSRFNTSSYVNDNHWIGSTWNGVRNNLPAVEIHSGGIASGNWFQNCYFESCDRQAVLFYRTHGGISGTYFEAIGEDGITYTTADGLTKALPAVDIQHMSNITLDGNFQIGAAGEAIAFGSSVFSATQPSRLTLIGTGLGGPAGANYWYTSTYTPDASWLMTVDIEGTHFVSTRGDNSDMVTKTGGTAGANTRVWDLWTPIGGNGGQHLPVDALWADWFEFHRGSHGGVSQNANPIVDNPTNETRGRELTFEFTSEDGLTISSITFGTRYKTAGAAVAPAVNKRRIYRFFFDGQYWVETYRSPADIG